VGRLIGTACQCALWRRHQAFNEPSRLPARQRAFLDETAALVGIDRAIYGRAHTALADGLVTAELIRRMKEVTT
jgi:hypothetical protein